MNILHQNTADSCRRFIKRLLLPCLALALFAGTACNSKEEETDNQTGYSEPTNVAVTAFSLKANSKILTALDSVYFSIDLDKAVIFNADSLPKGTKVTDLIPVIKYSSYVSAATINMEGGQKRTGEVNYKEHPNDSIDFTGRVTLTLTTSAGTSRTYDLKVNVHNTEPDSLCWGETAMSKLPAASASPVEQRTVEYKDKVNTLIKEQDGTYTLAVTEDPGVSQWSRTSLQLPFSPRVRTLTATKDRLWMLAADGDLYTSADGLDWQPSGENWYNILGEYNDVLLGVKKEADNTYAIVSKDDVYPATPLPSGFPIEDYSNIYSYKSKWMQSPISVLCGGVTADGQISSRVWAFDGTSWAVLSSDRIPALRGALLVPYYTFRRNSYSWSFNEYSTILLLGGLDAQGNLNKQTYLTYDNGVNWTAASSLLCLPEYIPPFWLADHTIQRQPMQAPLLPTWKQTAPRHIPAWYGVEASVDNNTVSWECPYIYLYGGCDAQASLHNTIWRGVINRLTFKPII